MKRYWRISLEISDFLKRDYVFRVLRFIIPFWCSKKGSCQYFTKRLLNSLFNLSKFPIWRVTDPDQALDRVKVETGTFRKWTSRNVFTIDLTYFIRSKVSFYHLVGEAYNMNSFRSVPWRNFQSKLQWSFILFIKISRIPPTFQGFVPWNFNSSSKFQWSYQNFNQSYQNFKDL